MSSARDSSQARFTLPVDFSTSNAEPTLTTTRRAAVRRDSPAAAPSSCEREMLGRQGHQPGRASASRSSMRIDTRQDAAEIVLRCEELGPVEISLCVTSASFLAATPAAASQHQPRQTYPETAR